MAWKKRFTSVRTELEREDSLDRARNGTSLTNEMRVLEGFKARGIPAEDIKPRENCLSYGAWAALGRQVLKGQKGVKVMTMILKEDESGVKRKVWREAAVFHLSQTLPQAEAVPVASALAFNQALADGLKPGAPVNAVAKSVARRVEADLATVADLVAAVRVHAHENYGKDGWSIVVESWPDSYIVEALGKARTVKGAVANVKAVLKASWVVAQAEVIAEGAIS